MAAEIALGIHWTGGWVDPRAGLDAREKNISCPCWESNIFAITTELYKLCLR
jgi:hypothetical protein